MGLLKVVGQVVLIVVSIIGGAIVGAVVGAIFAPAKVWEMFGTDSSNVSSEYVEYDDRI